MRPGIGGLKPVPFFLAGQGSVCICDRICRLTVSGTMGHRTRYPRDCSNQVSGSPGKYTRTFPYPHYDFVTYSTHQAYYVRTGTVTYLSLLLSFHYGLNERGSAKGYVLFCGGGGVEEMSRAGAGFPKPAHWWFIILVCLWRGRHMPNGQPFLA